MTELLQGGVWLVGIGLVVAGMVVVIGLAAAARGVKARREDPTTNPVDLEPINHERTIK